jgi:hypothetical protein
MAKRQEPKKPMPAGNEPGSVAERIQQMKNLRAAADKIGRKSPR